MSNAGNENNDTFWAPEHVVHSPQNQQQFIAPDGSLPTASNSYFNPNTTGEPHGISYGHPSPGDNFTVLSDGFGNFIKVYHQPSEDVNLNNPAGKYEYELFSSNNSYMRPAPGFGYLFQPQQQQQQPSVSKATNSHIQHNAQPDVPGSNTSMLINQLVGNWAPTISGTYSPFGGGGPSLLAEGLPRSSEAYVQQHEQPQKQQQQQPQPQCAQLLQQQPVHQQQQQQQPQQLQPSPVHQSVTNSSISSSPPQPLQQAPLINVSATASYNNQLNDDNSAKLNQNVKKQRIVAEVKPMRMSYSDVLSKNVPLSNATHSSSSPGTSTMNGSTAIGIVNNSSNVSSGKANTSNNGIHSGGNGYSSSGNGNGKSNNKNKKSSMQHGGSTMTEDKSNRKTDRNAVQKKAAFSNGTAPSANYQQGENSTVHKSTTGQGIAEKTARKMDKPVAKTVKNRFNDTSGLGNAGRKNRSRNFNDEYTVQDVQGSSSIKESTRDDTEDLDDEDDEDDDDDQEDSEDYEDDSPQQQAFMYNVKKNNNLNDTHIERISGSRTAYKKGGKASGTGRCKLEKSYTQSTGKRGQRPRKNQKYVMVQKILNTWFEFMLFAITWLWSLVSDVVYLSFRLCWDYLVAGYQYCEQYFVNIKQEFQQNRPGTWFKGIWKSFDNHFATDSKWAFWRGKKKPIPVEEQPPPGKNYYKDGRLPSTADEAMSSLLNCKGKDAYSILGVSPDCSQEQIRKHYKKIAVLVHPDKNKQPGAEEAFKVLQRSFELIGEPENRKSYNQSLAEALNAEKAWSEINDLLTQLHTKISEAANTIRCSSCCLRHPRKPTGRPHYAARECNSCKIRHSAREGDIWAETSLFGLRWKYLAMMEGNVYDITEWANCQKGALSHLQPNSHIVQYRIVLGGNSQQQQQQQGNQQQADKEPARSRKDVPPSEPNLDDFLNNIYGGQNQPQQQQAQGGTRRRHRRN